MTRARRVIGVDPGSRITGYGIVDAHPRGLRYVTSGRISTARGPFPDRLAEIYRAMAALIGEFRPDEFAIEEVFLARNPASALKLGQARGVAIAAAVAAGVEVAEYAARRVKQSVVGTGAAGKEQVQHMVRVLLELDGIPAEDAADALAVAICHVNSRPPPDSLRDADAPAPSGT